MPLADWSDLPGRRDTSKVPGRRVQTIKVKPGESIDDALDRIRETVDALNDVRAKPVIYLSVSRRPPRDTEPDA